MVRKIVCCLIFFVFISVSNLKSAEVVVGFVREEPVTTFKLQCISGNWNVNLYPYVYGSAEASSTAMIVRKVNYEEYKAIMIPGDDIVLMKTPRGIVARMSSENNIKGEYNGVLISGGELISIELPNRDNMIFKGSVQINQNKDGLILINRVTPEDYTTSVTSIIAETTSEIEATKACIIAVRTRLAYFLKQNRHPEELYDLCNTTHCMPYLGCGVDRELVALLANESKGKILKYGNKPINARFHHTCGGKISSAEDVFGVKDEPYNIAHNDLKDEKGSENCFHSPSFHWNTSIDSFEFMDFIAVSYAGGIQKYFLAWEPEKKDKTGRITSILLRGKAPKHIKGCEFAHKINNHFGPNSLKSMNFTYKEMKRSIEFKGYGQGDGVGMCLYGCDGLAKKGVTSDYILKFYYPGTQIGTIKW